MNKTPKPCRCDAETHQQCTRAGRLMTEANWKLCAGVAVPFEVSLKYRRLWDRRGGKPLPVHEPEQSSTEAPRGPCIHLGEYTGETVECQACKGTVKLKVLGCALHQTCTIAKKAGKHACCKTCPDYKENNNGRSS